MSVFVTFSFLFLKRFDKIWKKQNNLFYFWNSNMDVF